MLSDSNEKETNDTQQSTSYTAVDMKHEGSCNRALYWITIGVCVFLFPEILLSLVVIWFTLLFIKMVILLNLLFLIIKLMISK